MNQSNELRVKQLTVEVKVLRIGKKQCTISVFNQIEHILVYKPDPFFVGLIQPIKLDYDSIDIWGYVLYKNNYWIIANHLGSLIKIRMPPIDCFEKKTINYPDDWTEEDLIEWCLFISRAASSEQLFIAV